MSQDSPVDSLVMKGFTQLRTSFHSKFLSKLGLNKYSACYETNRQLIPKYKIYKFPVFTPLGAPIMVRKGTICRLILTKQLGFPDLTN